MIFDFLFKRKKQPAAPGAAPTAQEEAKPKQKESIEERIDREMKYLPSSVKNKVCACCVCLNCA